MADNLDKHGHQDPEYVLSSRAYDKFVESVRANLEEFDALDERYSVAPQAKSLPDDSEWKNVGPDLGGLMAEALGAYAIWRTTPHESGEVSWSSRRGHDVVATDDGTPKRIDVKRAWRDRAPEGHFYCAPLAKNVPIASKENVDSFALVLLNDSDLEWRYTQEADGAVTLQAKAKPSEVYLIGLQDAARLNASNEIKPDGKAMARWIVREAAVAGFRIRP